MSMELGNSNNLLSGGGGRVNIFWRSRTDFERKLLVVIFVLSAAVIALTVALSVVASQGAVIKGSKMVKHTAVFSFLDPKDFNLPPGHTPTLGRQGYARSRKRGELPL